MATIRSRKTSKGDRRWQAIVRIKGAPQVVETFGTKTHAKQWAQRVEAEIRAGRYLPRREAELHTVAEAIERYERDRLPELVEREQAARRSKLAWWGKRLGTFSLASVTPGLIAEARDALLAGKGSSGRPVSGPTTNRYVAAISAVLDLAAREWYWMEDNPARRIKRMREHPGRVRFLSDDERERLLEAAKASTDRRLYSLALLALTTGARQGELLGLRWQDVDLDRSPPRAILDKTKNRSRRSLSFPGPAADVLRELARTPHISGYVFATRLGEPTFPRTAWERALEAAGIKEFTFHDLRHSFASYAAMSGASLPELAALLGHKSMAMVARYAHLAESHSEKVAERMVEKFLA